jgi:hypothetical protein
MDETHKWNLANKLAHGYEIKQISGVYLHYGNEKYREDELYFIPVSANEKAKFIKDKKQ